MAKWLRILFSGFNQELYVNLDFILVLKTVKQGLGYFAQVIADMSA